MILVWNEIDNAQTTRRRPSAKAAAHGFTLVELMIVVAVVALLALLAIPGFLRARKRVQAAKVMNDLRMIDSAVNQYAIETGKKTGDPVSVPDWTNYVKRDTSLYATGDDALGNYFGDQTVDELPTVPPETYDELQGVVEDEFWDPYDP